MTPGPLAVAAWPLAARLADIADLANGWQVVAVPPGQQSRVAGEIADQLAGLLGREVPHLPVVTPQDLERVVTHDRSAALVLSGFEGFTNEAWRVTDMARSRLERDGQTLLVLASPDVARIPALAPNLWSWIGDGVWTLVPETGLDDAEREQRLAVLRAQFGFDDAELLRRARAGVLPRDADIAEWLVLLGEVSMLTDREGQG